MKVVATVQVRMGSSRLPGKAMMDLLGKPVLGRLLERAERARSLDEVVVATSLNKRDDIIQEYCWESNILCFRGSENDVLGRILGALKSRSADIGVELFGDCPLIDPKIIDQHVSFFMDNLGKYDFVGNDLKSTYPPGTEVEVYSVEALEDAANRTKDPEVREHGTLFIRQHPEIYRLHNIEAPDELRYPEMEIELDTEEDFQVIEAIFRHFLDRGKPDFNTYDVVEFMLNNPHIQGINQRVERQWKQYRKDDNAL